MAIVTEIPTNGSVGDVPNGSTNDTAGALQDSGDIYATLLETSPEAILVQSSEEGTIIFANAAAARLVGAKNQAELVGKRILDYLTAEFREAARERLRRLIAGLPVPHTVEGQFLRPDGTTVDTERSASVCTYMGQPAVQSIIRDVTARNRAETALRESERRFHDFTEAASDWYWETDGAYCFTDIVDGSDQAFTYRIPKRLGNMRFDMRLPEDTDDAKWDAHRANIEAQRPFRDFVYMARTEDGEIRHIRVSGKPVFDGEGNFSGYRGVGADFTSEMEAEARARHAEAELRQALESISEGFAFYDADDRLAYLNTRMKAFDGPEKPSLFPGETFETVLRRRLAIGFFEDAKGREEDWLKERLLRHRNPHGTMEQELSDGRWLRISERTTPAGGTVLMTSDISEHKRIEKALRDSEARFRTLIEGANMGVVVIRDDQILFANQALAEMIGYDRSEEIVALGSVDAYVAPEDRARMRAYREARITGEAVPSSHEFRALRKDGGERWFESHPSIIAWDDEPSILVIMHDVTERRRATDALERSEARFRSLLEQSKQGISIQVDDRLVFANQAYAEIYGYDRPDDIVALGSIDAYAASEDIARLQGYREARREGRDTPSQYEFRGLRKDGSEVWVEKRMQVITWDDRPATLAMATDIGSRKHAEEALKKSEERFRKTFESAGIGMILYDRDGLVIDINPACASMLGYAPEELIGCNYTILQHPDEATVARENFVAMRSGELFSYTREKRFLRKDGSMIWGRVTFTVIGTEDGMAQLQIGMIEDVTAEKQAGAALLASREKLSALANELSTVEARERRRFATYLHDKIGQTLAVMRIQTGALATVSESVERNELTDSVNSLLKEAIESCQTLTLDLSSPVLYELGLGPAVEEAGESICAQNGLAFEFETDGDRPLLDDDTAAFLLRGAKELMMNVVKHAQASKIRSAVQYEGPYLRVIVEDNGNGFDHSTVDTASGVHFGLFSIRERMDHIGGSLKIECTPDSGTRVTLLVPIASGRDETIENNPG